MDLLHTLPGRVLDDHPERRSAATAFHLPGVPALAFLDDYSRLPIHTAQDTIALMGPVALAAAAEVVATAMSGLVS